MAIRDHRNKSSWMRAALLGWLILGLSGPLFSQLPEVARLKNFETERFRVFHTPEMKEEARRLADDGEVFLNELSARWSVIFPKQKITFTLGKPSGFSENYVNHLDVPKWLEASYDTAHHRVELRIHEPSKFEYPVARDIFRHSLVHALLNLPRVDRLPRFWEEGLAMHYASGDGTRQRFFAILGFQSFEKTEDLVKRKRWASDQEQLFYGAAIGGLFVDWLWGRRPEGEALFMQELFKGRNWKTALNKAGFKDVSGLTLDFDFYIRPKYKLYTMVYTLDFWAMLFSLVWLVFVVVRLRKAFLTARMPHTHIEPVQDTVTADDFKGPIFGGMEAKADDEPAAVLNLTPDRDPPVRERKPEPPARPTTPRVTPPPRSVTPPPPPPPKKRPMAPPRPVKPPPQAAPARGGVVPPPPPGTAPARPYRSGVKPPAPKPLDLDDAFADLDDDFDAAFAELEKDKD